MYIVYKQLKMVLPHDHTEAELVRETSKWANQMGIDGLLIKRVTTLRVSDQAVMQYILDIEVEEIYESDTSSH